MRYVFVGLVGIVAISSACASSYTLSGMADFLWYHGCSPTSGGMLIDYWDSHGYGNLYNEGAGYQPMVSSNEHNSSPYSCTHTNAPNSVACYMHTDAAGSTQAHNMFWGLLNYTYDHSYTFSSNLHYTYNPNYMSAGMEPWTMSFDLLKEEIHAGRPMLINLSMVGGGHTVAAYGYQDNGPGDQWFAVRDTWQNGDSGSYGAIDKVEDGHEWWKWVTPQAGWGFGSYYYIDDGIYFGPLPGGWTSDGGSNDSFASPQYLSDLTDRRYTVSGEIASQGEEDWYAIYLIPGNTIIASTSEIYGTGGQPPVVDSVLELYAPDSTYVIGNDDQWGTKSHLFYEADEAGWWRLRVIGYGGTETGDYRLSINAFGAIPEPGTVALFVVGLAAIGVLKRRRARANRG